MILHSFSVLFLFDKGRSQIALTAEQILACAKFTYFARLRTASKSCDFTPQASKVVRFVAS
jgi:hypothetical protein